jgi:hypothetical protein
MAQPLRRGQRVIDAQAYTGLWNQPIRLRAGVVRIDRAGGQILFADAEGHAVRVSPSAAALWPQLSAGASPAKLAASLGERFPHAARIDEQVLAFVGSLEAGHLLDGAPPDEPIHARRLTAVVDWLAAAIAVPVCRRKRTAAGAALVIAIAAVVVIAHHLATVRPRSTDMLAGLSWISAVFVLAVAVPLHELAHAITARAVGVRVTEVGVTLRGLPRPYVSTPGAITAPRRHRVAIAAAGPFMDLIVAAGAALAAQRGVAAAHVVAVWMLFCALASTSPLIDSDGARVLHGVFNDELVRTRALGGRVRLTSARDVRLYRVAIAVHLAVSALLLGSLLR